MRKKCALYTGKSVASLLLRKFSLHYLHKVRCLVMRIKQMILHSNLSKIKK